MRANAGPNLDTPREGPGWPIGPAWSLTTASGSGRGTQTLKEALWSRGAVSWYIGGCISVLWLINGVTAVIAAAKSPLSAAAATLLFAVFAFAFLIAAPLAWWLPFGGRLAVCAGLFALSFALFPWIQWQVVSMWTYVGVIVGMCVFTWRLTLTLILGLGALALLILGLEEGWSEDILWLPFIIVSISLMMAAFGRSVATIRQLRATRAELEVMAAERERGRVARDIHDILGHSLTVITVKSELAGRLIDVDTARAKTEIAEIEELARGALADVRATVAGFRGVTVSGELAAAKSALDAAGIAYELPSSTDAVPPAHRELAGWVVREGITNVVRHSRASHCRIRLGSDSIEIADDGVGPVEGCAASTGLSGLRERIEAAGGRMSIGRSDLGGFKLEVAL